MAKRRMFSRQITDSDPFLDMPLSAQALYFHLGMNADDDGFINNAKRIQRMIGANDDDLKLLIAKHFVLAFDTGVVVIKHWKVNNSIRKDRYTPTVYTDEKAQLTEKDYGAYTWLSDGIPNDSQRLPQVRLGKVSIDKGCCYTDVWKEITTEQIDALHDTYEDASDLIQAVYEDVKDKRKNIDNIYAYIVGYANNKGWKRHGRNIEL